MSSELQVESESFGWGVKTRVGLLVGLRSDLIASPLMQVLPALQKGWGSIKVLYKSWDRTEYWPEMR